MYCTLHLEHCIIYDFYVCQPIIFNLFILIILNLVTVSFDFYIAFAAPDEGEFCLTETLGNKIITLLSCPISLAIGFPFWFARPENFQNKRNFSTGCPKFPTGISKWHVVYHLLFSSSSRSCSNSQTSSRHSVN